MIYNIGLVGTGRWAKTIAGTISTIPDTNIVAIYQRTSKEIPWLPEKCAIYDNISDMLRKTTLTHIITAIDPSGHYEIVERATKYRLPVWLEKPIALSHQETERIFALEGDIFVDYIHLYSECFQFLCNKIKIDNIKSITSVGYGFAPNINHKFSMLYDFASHDLAILLYLFSDIKIQNVYYIKGANGEYYDISLQSNNIPIKIEVGNDGEKSKSKSLFIDDGDKWYYDGRKQTISKNGEVVFTAKELPLKHALQAFLSGIRVNKEMTLKMMKILDEIEVRVK